MSHNQVTKTALAEHIYCEAARRAEADLKAAEKVCNQEFQAAAALSAAQRNEAIELATKVFEANQVAIDTRYNDETAADIEAVHTACDTANARREKEIQLIRAKFGITEDACIVTLSGPDRDRMTIEIEAICANCDAISKQATKVFDRSFKPKQRKYQAAKKQNMATFQAAERKVQRAYALAMIKAMKLCERKKLLELRKFRLNRERRLSLWEQ